jgi:thiamine phosphate synthase YjbQ (UPF0047 family)
MSRGLIVHTATLEVSTAHERELVDITDAARAEVRRSGVREGVCALYAHGATAALMVQENDDPNLAFDHIQAGIVGPSETVPVRDGQLALSRWQNVFLCDFDGPRRVRRILVTITGRAAPESGPG